MTTDSNAQNPPPSPQKRSKLPILIVAGLMLVEGVAIFAAAKYFLSGSPTVVKAADADAPPDFGADRSGRGSLNTAEVELSECRPSNTVTGRLLTFRVRVSALVKQSDHERMKTLVTTNQARITDRVNYVVRSAEPQQLNEPGLESIKRRLKHEFDAILGDETLIQEVLIPEMLQSGPGL